MSLIFLKIGLSCLTSLEPETGQGVISERPSLAELSGHTLEEDAYVVLTGIVVIGLTPAAIAYPSGLFDYGSSGHVLYILLGAVSGLVTVFSMEKTAHNIHRVD